MRKENSSAFVPIVLTSGTAFQPELLVIVLGTAFAARVDPELLHGIESTLGGVWVFGQLILFGMLGSKTSLEPLQSSAGMIFPCMLVGFVFRFIGVVIGLHATRSRRTCSAAPTEGEHGDFAANSRSIWPDIGFCFLSTIPRA